MRTRIPLLAATVFLVAGCSGNPTASDEYRDLEQQLETVATHFEEVTAERDALVAESNEAATTEAVPGDIATLIDDWYAANERGDGSIVDLYLPSGYHLYGTTRIQLDGLADHLSGGNYENEWITEPLLITNEGDGRYVVARGMRNTGYGQSYASSLTFEIVTMANGELRLAQSSWLFET
jgi:hypothetical protein